MKTAAATIGMISFFAARFANFVNRIPYKLFQQIADSERERYKY